MSFCRGILFISLCLLGISMNGQEKPAKSLADNATNICQEVDNTYQVIVSDPRVKLALTSDVCEVVKRERKKSETVYYKYDRVVTLKIYAEDELKKIRQPMEKIIYSER